jgi:hypothetical protein
MNPTRCPVAARRIPINAAETGGDMSSTKEDCGSVDIGTHPGVNHHGALVRFRRCEWCGMAADGNHRTTVECIQALERGSRDPPCCGRRGAPRLSAPMSQVSSPGAPQHFPTAARPQFGTPKGWVDATRKLVEAAQGRFAGSLMGRQGIAKITEYAPRVPSCINTAWRARCGSVDRSGCSS